MTSISVSLSGMGWDGCRLISLTSLVSSVEVRYVNESRSGGGTGSEARWSTLGRLAREALALRPKPMLVMNLKE